MKISDVEVEITYKHPGSPVEHTEKINLLILLRCAMKPAGIFVESTKGNIAYHKQLLSEVQSHVIDGKPYGTLETMDETVAYLVDVAKHLSLCEVSLKHFIEEQPLPYMFEDKITAFEISE